MNKLDKILNTFKEQFSSKFSAAALVGSTVYLNELREGSDIDLVIIMDTLNEWKEVCKAFCPEISNEVISSSIDLYKKNKVKYFCLKFKIDDTDFSVDFILKDNIISFNDNFDLYLKEKTYKVSPTKQNACFKFGRDSTEIVVDKENLKHENLFLIHSPYAVLTNNKFYTGILLSKFINGYTMLWDNIQSEVELEKFCQIGIKKSIEINKHRTFEEVLQNIATYEKLPKNHIKKQIERYIEVFNKMETKEDTSSVLVKLGVSGEVATIYKEIYELFPPDTGKPELRYVRRTWIFPQHLNIMLKMASKMCEKYGGDKDTCYLAVILHDVGLVYGRTSASPEGHEERSMAYTKEILEKHGYEPETVEQVIKCIAVTNSDIEPVTVNEKIVRTADALSKFDSCHFIAKAAYSKDIDEYMTWMHKKLKKSYYKICFDDELKECENAYNYLINAVNSYIKQKDEFK
jgi:HD superfamily phosphodiesterase